MIEVNSFESFHEDDGPESGTQGGGTPNGGASLSVPSMYSHGAMPACALQPAAIFKMRCSDRLSPRSGRGRHHLRKSLVRRPSVSRFFNPFRRPLSRTRLSGGLVRITCFG